MSAAEFKPANAVDALPYALRAAVIDGILKGGSLRDIGKVCGLSPATIMRYRDKVVLPTLGVKHATVNTPIVPETPGETPGETGTKKGETVSSVSPTSANLIGDKGLSVKQLAVKTTVEQSPVRERLGYVWDVTRKQVDKCAAGDDQAPMAPLLNQAHKNIELLAKLTGELGDSVKGPAFAIQIVMPGIGAAPAVTVDMSEGATIIDVGANIGSGTKD